MLSVSHLGRDREAFALVSTYWLIRAGKENKHVNSALLFQAYLSNSDLSNSYSNFTFLYSIGIALNTE